MLDLDRVSHPMCQMPASGGESVYLAQASCAWCVCVDSLANSKLDHPGGGGLRSGWGYLAGSRAMLIFGGPMSVASQRNKYVSAACEQ